MFGLATYHFVLKLFRPKTCTVLKGRMHKKSRSALLWNSAAYALNLQKEPESNEQNIYFFCLANCFHVEKLLKFYPDFFMASVFLFFSPVLRAGIPIDTCINFIIRYMLCSNLLGFFVLTSFCFFLLCAKSWGRFCK